MPLAVTSRGDSEVHRQDVLKGSMWWENCQEGKGRARSRTSGTGKKVPGTQCSSQAML